MSSERLHMNLDESLDNLTLLTPPILRRSRAICSIDDPIENEILQQSLYQTPNYDPSAHLYVVQNAPKKNNKRKRDIFEENTTCKKRLEYDDPTRKEGY